MKNLKTVALKDKQNITSDWEMTNIQLIEGVQVKEVKNVIKNNGYLTEIYRKDWLLDDLDVEQLFQVSIKPNGVSAWHTHEYTTDRLFVNFGTIKIVLYDSREDSPTYGNINEFRISYLRPALVVVPPYVWHGIQNIGSTDAFLLNLVDKAYTYTNPDHWRLPLDTHQIPYQF